MKRDSVFGLVLSAFLGSLFSYVLPKLADALIPAFKGNALAEHPAETCMVAAFCACLGFRIGRASKVGGTDRSEDRRARHEMRQLARSRMRESSEQAKRDVKNIDINMKALMKVVSDGHAAYYRESEYDTEKITRNPFFAQFLETEVIDGGRVKVTATPLLVDLAEENQELFSCVPETVENHVMREDWRIVYFGYSMGAAPRWWWDGDSEQ